MAVWGVVQREDLEESWRLDAQYYQPVYLKQEGEVRALRAQPLETLASISDGNHLTISGQFGLGSIPYLRGGDLSNFFLHNVQAESIPLDAYRALKRSHMKPGDVLLSIVGTIGQTALVTSEYPKLTGSCKIAIIRPRGIRSGYLAAYLASPLGQDLIARRVRGAVQQGLILPDLKALPVPRLSEVQEEQIEMLVGEAYATLKLSTSRYAEAEALLMDALGLNDRSLPTAKAYVAEFSDVRDAERLDAEFFNPAHQFARAYLTDRFQGQPLAHSCIVTKGKTPTEYTSQGVPVVRSGDLADLDRADLLRTDPKNAAFRLKPGDVLISSIGFGSIGKVQVFDAPDRHTTVSEVTVVRPQGMNPYALKTFLASPLGQVQINSWVTGATGQLHLYPQHVEKIIVPHLPDGLQRQIEEKHREATSLKREAATMLEEAKRRVETLVREA